MPNQSVYVILRPLDGYTGEIPEATISRINEMRGIKAEKLASCSYGQTVNTNDEITYTFRLENHSNIEKTLTITDTLPENTTYVSGAQKTEGNQLEWQVKVPPKETVDISYSVKVSADALGKQIVSNSFVSNIPVNCPEILVAKTLTEEEQAEIIKNAEAAKTSDKTGIALANEIYGKDIFSLDTAKNIIDAVISPRNMVLGKNLELSDMVAPYLYGGTQVGEINKSDLMALKRTRYIRADLLIIGDIIATDNDLYLFVGDKLLDLNTNLTVETDFLANILAFDRFAVLRPSMGT